jgi:hypothetical protein
MRLGIGYISLAAGLLLGLYSEVRATPKYGMAGCGLGSLVFKSDGSQVSAATTNGSLGNQTFGMTSGTSNCIPSKEMAVILKQQEFLTANLATLQKELAQGQGDTVNAFADILGCNGEIHQQAVSQLVGGYTKIFKVPGIAGVLDEAKKQLSKDQQTAKGCNLLG